MICIKFDKKLKKIKKLHFGLWRFFMFKKGFFEAIFQPWTVTFCILIAERKLEEHFIFIRVCAAYVCVHHACGFVRVLFF